VRHARPSSGVELRERSLLTLLARAKRESKRVRDTRGSKYSPAVSVGNKKPDDGKIYDSPFEVRLFARIREQTSDFAAVATGSPRNRQITFLWRETAASSFP